MQAALTRTIEVFADVVCPFTHVALRRLFAFRDEMGRSDVAIRVRAWPLEIVNGELTSRELLTEEVEELTATVSPDLFRGLDPTVFPMSSLPALALAEHAYRESLGAGEQMSRALRDALFEEGRDLADPAELATIAGTAGVSEPEDVDRAAVLLDHAAGLQRGVIGSPHFFVEGAGFFCPTMEIERVAGRLEISFDEAGFTEFMRTCFGPPISQSAADDPRAP